MAKPAGTLVRLINGYSHDTELRLSEDVIKMGILTSQGLCSFTDPDKVAWAEHFLEVASLIITELSLFW